MAQATVKNNNLDLAQAWKVVDAKEQNALTNVQTHTQYFEEARQKAEELRQKAQQILKEADEADSEAAHFQETVELNQRIADAIAEQKKETVEAGAELAKIRRRISKLPPELQAIANQLGGGEPPTDPDPETQPETKEELVERWIGEVEEKTEQQPEQPEQQPEPIAASLPGETASEQIANIPPVEKKPEAPEEQQSELLPAEAADKIIENCFEIDGYSFKFNNKNFEFFTPDKQRFEGIWSDEKPAPIGLKTGNRKLFVSTLHPQEWLTDWDAHLFAIEKALQQFTKNADFRVKFPARTTSNLEKTPWRQDGCILLPMDGSAIKLTQKIDGYTVSFKDAKDFKVRGKQHTSVTLKILGEGTGSNGTEVNCSFKEGEEYFVVAVKLPDGSQSNDKTSTKRSEMPKWLKPLRNAAIDWMVGNFPYTASKWESEVNYITPAPVPTATQPSNAAANDQPVK